MAEQSKAMDEYFEELSQKINEAYVVAVRARKKGYDPEEKVDIPVAKNMAERVEGLMSAVAPQLVGKGMIQRIQELESIYGRLSWQVALVIAKEVAQEKFCNFKDKKEAMEVGIRAGFTYHTVGIVSAPLEGFVELKIKKRRDGKEYFAMSYAGPIRGAGGTAAAVSIIIADYIRKEMSYEVYDPDESEQNRAYTELQDYHERVTRLQYNPSEDEVKFLVRSLPIEIDGDPTEVIDVSNYKDIPRIETNKVRGGFCLVLSMVALKASKLWGELGKWGKDFQLDWTFLDEFLHLQKEKKAKKADSAENKNDKPKVLPDYTFVTDLVAGRPVLTHPLAFGGFRLRYGRSRVSGYSAASINPLTSLVLYKFVGTGTQLKTERPGKAASITFCDTVEGPIVKLYNGSVIFLESEAQTRQVADQVDEILFLGDILFSYGDFLDRNHLLIPPGYCEEWWILEFEKKIIELFGSVDYEQASHLLSVSSTKLKKIHSTYLYEKPTAKEAILFSEKLEIPLHPRYCFHWNGISSKELLSLLEWFQKANFNFLSDSKIILPLQSEKRLLERIGISHTLSTESIIIEGETADSIIIQLQLNKKNMNEQIIIAEKNQNISSFEIISFLSLLKLRDKSGIFIGARMGRPEKAKMRKLTGSPHVLFPVSEEGGRLRAFQAALIAGKITADLPLLFCVKCKKETVYRICETCENHTTQLYNCTTCGKSDKKCIHEPRTHIKRVIDIKHFFDAALKKCADTQYPDLIKGVRGMSNKDKTPECILKGILRAKHDIYVNKDGTTRYDMTELPITHFKPKEIGTNVKKLIELGYTLDCYGSPLVGDDQILEIKPQDAILPACPDSPDEGADVVLLRITQFVDELLVTLYQEKPFYNCQTKEDLVGQLIIGLAPHISAGILGRIIGFSKTQGCFGHPLWHAAHRRDCDGDENCVMLLMDALLNFSRQYLPNKRGAKTMDAPLVLTAVLRPAEVDDMVHKLDIAWKYPLAFYEAAIQYKSPRDVKIEKLGSYLDTEKQYEGMGFTHDTKNFNDGILCSSYKTLPSMQDKLKGQMLLAEKIRAVDECDVARLVIEKHFLKDIKGNLRKFSMQKFRCVKCNESFRRPPLTEKCTACGGNVIFTISEGSVLKYLEPSLSLAKKYNLSPYLRQTLELTKNRIEGMFGKEREKQVGLGNWFGP